MKAKFKADLGQLLDFISYFKYLRSCAKLLEDRSIAKKQANPIKLLVSTNLACGASVATSGAGRPLIPEPGASEKNWFPVQQRTLVTSEMMKFG